MYTTLSNRLVHSIISVSATRLSNMSPRATPSTATGPTIRISSRRPATSALKKHTISRNGLTKPLTLIMTLLYHLRSQ